VSALAKFLAGGLLLFIVVSCGFEVGKWQEGSVFTWDIVLKAACLCGLFFWLGYLAGAGDNDA
jgi:hypothetical protein